MQRWKKAKEGLVDFAQVIKPGYQAAQHHQLIARYIQEVEVGNIDRLMIFAPPRHGKSELSTRLFPAWYLGRHPDRFVISGSYNADFATDFGRDVRDIVADEFYRAVFPGVSLRPDTKAANRWHTNRKGVYVSAGIGSGITGRGAHLGLIDDPIKDRKEAESQAVRENVWEWYKSAFYTRLMPGGAIVITLTRWHDDDLAGRLLKEQNSGGDRWTILNLPAIAEAGDILGRQEGEALWPDWYPLRALERIKGVSGSYNWLSLYQQRPVAEEGNIFKKTWWRYYREMPAFSFILQSWDTAHEEKTEADFSVCTTWGVFQGGVYLIDWFYDKLDYPNLKRKAESLYARHQPHVVLVEEKASGKPLVQEFKKNSVMPVIGIKPEGDKVARAHAVTPIIEGAKVFLPEWAFWVTEYVDEMGKFPKAEHDDTVDSTTQALNYVRGRLYSDDFSAEDAQMLAAQYGYRM